MGASDNEKELDGFEAEELAGANKANSLDHAHFALQTQSIVITFNHRIGLLGYLPYVDLEDGAGPQQLHQQQQQNQNQAAGQARSNHALWDQIGLLHWLRHNVAQFGGEPANVTLLSGDAKSAQTIQLLAMSPLAKGLFKRLVLTHFEEEPIAMESTKHDYFGRLFALALRSRSSLRRRLINELGLIVKRGNFSLETPPGELATRQEATPADSLAQADLRQSETSSNNYELDRRAFEFLRLAPLSQLAQVELELAKVSVAAQQQQKPATALNHPFRLVELTSEPNLDDRLLFPYFSKLITMGRSSIASGRQDGDERDNEDVVDTDGAESERQSFWAGLFNALDRQQQQAQRLAQMQNGNDSIAAANSPHPSLHAIKLELEYCSYLRQLYANMFSNLAETTGQNSPNNSALSNDLKQFDPFKLIPRFSDRQLAQWSEAANGSRTNVGQGKEEEQGFQLQQQQTQLAKVAAASSSAGKQFIKWTQRNQTANALEFFHLRHAHLLQQLLVQRLQVKRNLTQAAATSLPGFGRGGLNNSDKNNLTLNGTGREVANNDQGGKQEERSNAADDDVDEEDVDEGDGLVARRHQKSIVLMQQQQHQQQTENEFGLHRNKRNSLDHLAALGQQLLELMSGFDLLVCFVGAPVLQSASNNDYNYLSELPTAFENNRLVRIMNQLNAANNESLNRQLTAYLQIVELHRVAVARIATIGSGSVTNVAQCDFDRRITQLELSNAANSNHSEISRNTNNTVASFHRDFANRDERSSILLIVPSWPMSDKSNERGSHDFLLSGANHLLGKLIGNFAATGRQSVESEQLQQFDEWHSNSIPEGPLFYTESSSSPTQEVPSDGQLGSKAPMYATLTSDLINVNLYLKPYLNRVFKLTKHRSSGAMKEYEQMLEHPLMPPVDLISCLHELDSSLAGFEQVDRLNQYESRVAADKTSIQLGRFNEEAHCLANATNKLRAQLRSGAAKELDPLITQYLVRISNLQGEWMGNEFSGVGRQQQQKRQMLALLGQHGQRVSSMTTRNLLNQSEGLYSDQSSPSLSGSDSQIGSDNELLNGGGAKGRSRKVGLLQALEVFDGNNYRLPPQTDKTNSSGQSGHTIRSFLSKTYKDAVGQALGIVVGTGLLIVLLHLIIALVLIVRNVRRRGAGSDNQQNEFELELEGTVPKGMNDEPPQPRGQQSAHLLGTLSGTLDLMKSDGHPHHHIVNGQQVQIGDGLFGIGECKYGHFAGHRDDYGNKFTPNSANHDDHQQIRSSSPMGSFQRSIGMNGKSIKFNLAETETQPRINGKGNRVSSKSIMKQTQSTFSDEDEMNLSRHMRIVSTNNNCLQHIDANKFDAERALNAGNDFKTLSAQETMLNCPTMQLTSHHAGLERDSGEVESLQYLNTLNKCRFHGLQHAQQQQQSQPRRQQHLDSHHHHHHHQQSRHQIQLQSLGSSALTSPFASQSTPTTSGLSSCNATIANLQEQCQLPGQIGNFLQQHKLQLTYAHPETAAVSSPTSSNTLSPTSILLTRQVNLNTSELLHHHHHHNHQHHSSSHSSQKSIVLDNDQLDLEQTSPSQSLSQVIGLIYPPDNLLSVNHNGSINLAINDHYTSDNSNLFMLQAQNQVMKQQDEQTICWKDEKN